MKICVLNGSPKGKYSCTLHTVLYLEKKFPQHEFKVLDVGQKIKVYEKNMTEAMDAIKECDLILFSYPVYTFLAPSQLHRFIELMKESGVDFSGKFATQITTSKHFYDVTAHKYVEDNAFDLGLKVIHGLSADMDDLTTKKGQEEAYKFMEYVTYCVENDVYEVVANVPVEKATEKTAEKTTEKTTEKAGVLEEKVTNSQENIKSYDTVIVTDLREGDDKLQNLIHTFRKVYSYPVRVVNISDYPFIGGCLGCFNCAADGKCIYVDGFDTFLRENIQTASAIVYAFTIKDHSMGAKFKMYDDRQFCNGHRTVTEGMPFGYLVNGDYEAESNLKTVVEARAEVGHNFLSGVGYNETTIEMMAKRLEYALEHKYVQPRTFYGIGGMKIFRDLIWIMRGLMKADHQFYKKHGVYDFPQKQWKTMWFMCFVGSLMRNPKVKKKMGNAMNEGMIAPYKKVLEKLEKES